MRIKRAYVFWIVVFIAQAVFVMYLRGWFNDTSVIPAPSPSPPPISALQTLTPAESQLVRGAVRGILREWDDFRSVDSVLEALRAGLPQHPRDTRPIVMGALDVDALGVPPDMAAVRERLIVLEGALP